MRRILLLLALLLPSMACHKESGAGVHVNSSLEQFVPPATSVLAGVDVERLKRSTLYQRHEKQLDLDFFTQFSERTRIDPRRDVSSLLIAWPGNQPVLIALGYFSQAAAKQQSSGERAFFFPKPDILVSGPHPSTPAGSGGIPAGLKARLQILSNQDQVWLISSQSLPLNRIPIRPDIESALSNLIRYVSGVSAGVAFSDGAQLEADLTCVSPEGAKQVHDALRGGIGFARLSTNDDETDLLHAYDAIQVDQDGQTVRLHATWPAALADQLIARFATKAGR